MIERLVLAVVAAAVLYVAKRLAAHKTLPLPPGPIGYPLIGNLLDLPTAGWDWKTFGAWADRYGPLISARAFGNTIVVINSHATALALLESRGAVYASRPHLVMPVDLMGWKDAMAFTPYGPRLRAYRRTFHAELGSRESVETYHPQEEEHARHFIRKVLESPEHLMDHCYYHAGAIVLRVAYGYHADEEHDPIIRAGNEAMASFNKGSSPSAFLVNTMPFLKHVPEWFPGAGFQRQARLWSSHYRLMVEPPFKMVKTELEKGTAEDNFVAKSLMKATTKTEEENIMHAAGSMFGGGGDTTAIAVHFFFLMMVLHPDVQRRAQAEIDAVVGRKHLPSFEDRERLPYVDAICKEILRMHPPVPN
ncbi:cytochrome P450, partial [Schizophyllum amplum]